MSYSKTSVLNYRFETVQQCEMCQADATKARVLGQRLNRSQGRKTRHLTGISVSVVKCRNCGLVFPQPMPIPADFQSHYGINPEEFWDESYYDLKPDYFSNEIRTAKELLGFKPGMRALDIGAGIGKCMISLANAGFDTYGIEPSKVFFDKAINRMKIDPARLSNGMVENSEFAEESFDFITYGAVFEHLYHPAACLERSFRWLKPGGIIHIEVPSARYFISKLFNFFYRLKGTRFVTNLSPMHVPYHLYEFELRSFEELGRRKGFQIERSDSTVCEIMHVPGFLKPLLRTYMKATKTGMQLTVYLRKGRA